MKHDSGAQMPRYRRMSACRGRTVLYRLQQVPSWPSERSASLQRQASMCSACLSMMRSVKWRPSAVSVSTRSSLNTSGIMTGGGWSCARRAARSAFIASTSACRMVSARSDERRSSTGLATGTKKMASARAKSCAPAVAPMPAALGIRPGSQLLAVEVMVSQGLRSGTRGLPCFWRSVSKVSSIVLVHAVVPPDSGLRRYQRPEPRTRRDADESGLDWR